MRHIFCICGLMLLAACSEEPPPITVEEFMEKPRLLEATMVRCAQNRSESRYLIECVNARDAVNRLEAAQEKTRREEFEKQSERKRQALRRTQEAAAEARRRTQEAQRLREQEQYLNIFDQPAGDSGAPMPSGNTDNATGSQSTGSEPGEEGETMPATPADEPILEDLPEEPETDLEAIREELKRRQQSND